MSNISFPRLAEDTMMAHCVAEDPAQIRFIEIAKRGKLCKGNLIA